MKVRLSLSIAMCLLAIGCDKATVAQLTQSLPSCQANEALKTVEQIINTMPAAKAANATFVSLKEIKEQGFNKDSEIRACGAILVTTVGEDKLQYSIKWQDKAAKTFFVEARISNDAPAAPANSMKEIHDQVASDAVSQYQIAKRSSAAPVNLCVQAGLVAQAFLQAKDEPNYVKWQAVEGADCARAGIQK